MKNYTLLTILLFILVACGGERRAQTIEPVAQDEVPTIEPTDEPVVAATPEPTSEAAATPTPEPTSSPEPTEEPLPTEEPSPTPETETDAAVDEEALLGSLLTLNDMPTGWTGEAATFEERTPGGTYQFTCVELPARSIAAAEADFTKSAFGPFLTHSITLYPDTGDATDALEDIISGAQECPQFTDDAENTYTLSPLSFPSYGDQTFAIRLSGTVEADLIYIRIRNVIMRIYHGGIGAIDSELTERMVTQAVERYTH